MTVAELRAKLAEFPDSMYVRVYDGDEYGLYREPDPALSESVNGQVVTL